MTLFSFLKDRYNEETLVYMLIAAKNAPSTEKIAIQIQAEQTKLWFKNEKSPSDVFKLLKLDEEGKSLFTSPLFNSWLKYLDEFNMLDPDAKAILAFSTLKNHYEDDELAKMTLREKLAERMHSEQLREWYSSLKPPEFVFKALKLDKMGSKLFERSLFTVWKDYVEFVKIMDPTIKGNMLTQLTKVYGGKKLVKMLIAAENVPKTKKIATELQDMQIKRWLDEKKTPKAVFSLLRAEGTAPDDAGRLLYDKFIEAFKPVP